MSPKMKLPQQVEQLARKLRDGTASRQDRNRFAALFREQCAEGSPARQFCGTVLKEYDEKESRSDAQIDAKYKQAEQRPQTQRTVAKVQPQPTRRRGPGPNSNLPEAKELGEPFWNPYTFIPFPSTAPTRREPTPLTADEADPSRRTGVLEIGLKTVSPLLSCAPIPTETNGDKSYTALRIAEDVIVPATGVRGALRSMLAALTGGTLGYLDENVWLTQGRDGHLFSTIDHGKVTEGARLARVLEPGGNGRSGLVELGDTRLILLADIKARLGRENTPRPSKDNKRAARKWSNSDGSSFSDHKDTAHEWELRCSGTPIGGQRIEQVKKEAIFKSSGTQLELPSSLWDDYAGRYLHADISRLKKDDLVWLEPRDVTVPAIDNAEQVVSIQWARLGRRGKRLLDVVLTNHTHLIPDSFNPDGLVDEVTDLFGQVPRPDLAKKAFPSSNAGPGPAGPFAARVRPENLVFEGCAGRVKGTPLAPLMPPHPGCAAFYRDETNPDLIANDDSQLRGYKVYRTTSEQGHKAPWHYNTQGVYRNGRLQPGAQQKTAKTCELLPEGNPGKLRIACRALTNRELALLFSCCKLDWRLGGGKPLGLGVCRVTKVDWIDEDGRRISLVAEAGGTAPTPVDDLARTLESEVNRSQVLRDRMALWRASQTPVDKLRYPRALERDNRGGHVWFGKHARPSMSREGVGLEPTTLPDRKVKAQPLPKLTSGTPAAESLYGYDLRWPEGVPCPPDQGAPPTAPVGNGQGNARPNPPRPRPAGGENRR